MGSALPISNMGPTQIECRVKHRLPLNSHIRCLSGPWEHTRGPNEGVPAGPAQLLIKILPTPMIWFKSIRPSQGWVFENSCWVNIAMNSIACKSSQGQTATRRLYSTLPNDFFFRVINVLSSIWQNNLQLHGECNVIVYIILHLVLNCGFSGWRVTRTNLIGKHLSFFGRKLLHQYLSCKRDEAAEVFETPNLGSAN